MDTISSDILETTPQCPVTGLPIYTRPEWTNIHFGSDYFLTLKVAGDNILLCQAYGNATLKDAREALIITAKVVKEVFGNSHYIQLENYSRLRTYSIEARHHYINEMKQRDRILALIFHNVPLILKMTIQLGKRLHHSNFDVFLASNYEQAMNRAQKVLDNYRSTQNKEFLIQNEHHFSKSKGFLTKRPPHQVISRKEWELAFNSFSLRFEIINSEILHSIPKGRMDQSHLPFVVELREKVIQALREQGHFRYLIINTRDFKSLTPRVRKLYGKSLLDIHKKYAFKILIYYGENKFVQTAVNLAKPLLPFKIRAVKSFEDALKLIAQDKKQAIETTSGKKLFTNIFSAKRRTQQYVDEIIAFLGNIDWEKDGFHGFGNYLPSHPFRPVFDSIRFIKRDMDNLLSEKNQAEQANIAKNEILDNMTHEFRTPMHGILSFSRFGMDKIHEVPREKLLEYFFEIYQCASQVMELLEELFELTRFEINHQNYHMAEHDIQKIIDSVISNLGSEAKKKNIIIMIHHSEISTWAVFDAQKIYRALEILLSNAIDNSNDNGKIRIFFEKSHITQDVTRVEAIHVNIADEGIAIADDELTLIFDKFFQSDRTRRQKGGTSLGLSICKRILDAHQGKIWAEHNKDGKGNVFIMALPYKAARIDIWNRIFRGETDPL